MTSASRAQIEHPVARARNLLRARILDVIAEHAAVGDVPGELPWIWLFGSFAKGGQCGLSDVDLLYVWPDEGARRSFWRRRPSLETFLAARGLPRRVGLLEAVVSSEGERHLRALRELGEMPILIFPRGDRGEQETGGRE